MASVSDLVVNLHVTGYFRVNVNGVDVPPWRVHLLCFVARLLRVPLESFPPQPPQVTVTPGITVETASDPRAQRAIADAVRNVERRRG